MSENMFSDHNFENNESENEQLNDQLDDLLKSIELSSQNTIEFNRKEEFNNLIFDLASFNNGIKKVSELCGMITALSNVGVSPVVALQYISNREDMSDSISSNEKIAELNNKSNIECAKSGAAFMKTNNI